MWRRAVRVPAPAALPSAWGAEQDVISPGSAGLQFTPDEHLSFQRQPDGSFKLWFSGGGTIGTLGFTTPDLLALTSMKTSNGVPSGVLLPAGPGTTAFDADYARRRQRLPRRQRHRPAG